MSRTRRGSAVVPEIRTERLLMRGFTRADLAGFSQMNADPRVMEHYLRPMTAAETRELADRIDAQWRTSGWGLWGLERRDTGEFIGYTGLWPVRVDLALPARVEIGWRLAFEHWGQGFATEAARAAADHAFGSLGLVELVSFTATGNLRSRAVMERIGMRRDPDFDFDHPAVPPGHPLRRHVVYRLAAHR